MMKIGIDVREIRDYITGIGRFLLEFLKEANKYKEFEFILFGNQYTNFSKNELVGYKKIVMKEKITLWWDQVQLNRAANENKIDVFFSPYYKMPIFSNIPTVIFLFDIIYLKVEPYKSRFKNKCYIKNYIKFASRKAQKILTCSYFTKKDLIDILNLPEQKLKVVYLSVDEKFRPQSLNEIQQVKQKYNIQKKYFLYVSNSKPHKNLNRLIQAYTLLSDEIKKEYQLVLGGVGNFFNSQFSTLNSQLINFIPDEDLPGLYSGAELFVFPSLYEGFGLPPLEAMACGTPVITSNASSLPEVVGDATILVNPYDVNEIKEAIEKVLTDEQLKNSMIEKGLLRARYFTVEKQANKILEIFQEIIADK